jgi:hypothetical protein
MCAGHSVTEEICNRGTVIHGTKGELIGDMKTFVSPLNPYPAYISHTDHVHSDLSISRGPNFPTYRRDDIISLRPYSIS